MKYPIITYKQMCKLLKRNGYKLDRFNGDHAIYVKNGCNHVSVSFKFNPMVARRLINERVYVEIIKYSDCAKNTEKELRDKYENL